MTPFIALVLALAATFFASALGLSVYIVMSKRKALYRAQFEQATQARWRLFFATALESVPPPEGTQPVLAPNERVICMSLWLYWLSMLDVRARKNLVKLGIELKLHRYAHEMLASRKLDDMLIALEVLGMLRYRKGMLAIKEVMASDDPELSFIAARALLHSKNKAAWQAVQAEIERSPKWSGARIEALVSNAQLPSHYALDLWCIAQRSTPARCASLLRVIAACDPIKARPILHLVLSHPGRFRSQVLAVALKGLEDHRDVELARSFLAHRRTHIRMAAATALGRLGSKSDIPLIMPLLHDKAWWTRVRAAEAVVALAREDAPMLVALMENLTDPYGKDALRLAQQGAMNRNAHG